MIAFSHNTTHDCILTRLQHNTRLHSHTTTTYDCILTRLQHNTTHDCILTRLQHNTTQHTIAFSHEYITTQHTIAFSHDYNTTHDYSAMHTHASFAPHNVPLRESSLRASGRSPHSSCECLAWRSLGSESSETRKACECRRDGLNAVLCWTRDETRRDSPVGFAGVVLVRDTYGFLHPLRVDPPQLQRVIHPTRHDLLPKQVEVLKTPAFRDTTVSVLTEFMHAFKISCSFGLYIV